jgi:hypothetical protein
VREPQTEQSEEFASAFVDYKAKITRFTADLDVPFDNNQSETRYSQRQSQDESFRWTPYRKKRVYIRQNRFGTGFPCKQAKHVMGVHKNAFTKPNKSALGS